MHNPCFAVSGVKSTSIHCWEEILNPPSGLLMLRSALAALVVDGETSRGRHCTLKKTQVHLLASGQACQWTGASVGLVCLTRLMPTKREIPFCLLNVTRTLEASKVVAVM